MLESWLGLKPGRWITSARHQPHGLVLEAGAPRRDLYPKLKKVVSTDKKVYNHELVRNEMFLALGRYVTESSGHNSEYNWWFRKRADLIRQYCTTGTGWNPGRYAFILNEYRKREKTWRQSVREWLAKDEVSLERGHEYAASIITPLWAARSSSSMGTLPTTVWWTTSRAGPASRCRWSPAAKGLSRSGVGSLPPQCAMLTGLSAQIEMMAVEGCSKGDAGLVYQAIAHDPLTAAKLSLAEARKMVKEMLRKNRKWLPQFKKVEL